MDVAASVVSIISFGLQTCQGLTDYYSAWKDCDEDVAATCKSIEALEAIFALIIKTVINHSSANPDILTQVKKNADSCAKGVDNLKEKLEKIRKTKAPVTSHEKVGRVQKALYPFKKSTLAKLAETVQDLRDNLSLSLDLLQMLVK